MIEGSSLKKKTNGLLTSIKFKSSL